MLNVGFGEACFWSVLSNVRFLHEWDMFIYIYDWECYFRGECVLGEEERVTERYLCC